MKDKEKICKTHIRINWMGLALCMVGIVGFVKYGDTIVSTPICMALISFGLLIFLFFQGCMRCESVLSIGDTNGSLSDIS